MKRFLQSIKALFTKSETEKTSLQKTARASIIVGGIALVAVIVYFAAIAPLLKSETARVPDLFEGEYYQGGSIYMLRPMERSEIKSVKIKNEKDTYTLNAYAAENGEVMFDIEGHEDTVLSYEKVSSLIGDVRILVTNSPAGQDRVFEKATDEDLRNYGLNRDADPSYFEVTLNDGTAFRILVGKALPTSRGYYALVDGRKNKVTAEDGTVTEYDIVYSLELSGAALLESASLVSPQLAAAFGNSIGFTKSFILMRYNGGAERDTIVRVGRVPKGEEGVAAAGQTFRLIYPGSYQINEDTFGTDVLTPMASVTASAIVAYGEEIHTPEVYEKYGLDLDKERLKLLTDKNYAQVYIECPVGRDENGELETDILYFSKKFTDLDGVEYYYVYSTSYGVIGKVMAAPYAFLEWKVTDFTNPYMYFEYFTSATRFEVLSPRNGLDHRFEISGKELTRHVDVTNTKGETLYRTVGGSKVPLCYDVKYKRNGSAVQYEGDFEIFRNLYYVLITRKLSLDAEIDREVTEIDTSAPSHIVRASTTAKDSPISYYMYGEGGKRGKQVHDEGGNILCHNVKVETKLPDGTVKTLDYDKAFYDEAAKRFFLKVLDTNDGNQKPASYKDNGNGGVEVTLFLPESTVGEYTETHYTYELFDMYDKYTDYDGNERKQLNSTYMYLVPTVERVTYRIGAGGEKTEVSRTVSKAEEGVFIRTSVIDKLFSDTQRLLDGKEIDTMGVN